jgi:hypothetical protein
LADGKDAVLPLEKRKEGGSYRSRFYRSTKDRRKSTNGVAVHVVKHSLRGIPDADDLCRLITTISDSSRAPANDLAALYHEPWKIETGFGEFKNHL